MTVGKSEPLADGKVEGSNPLQQITYVSQLPGAGCIGLTQEGHLGCPGVRRLTNDSILFLDGSGFWGPLSSCETYSGNN